MSRRCEECGEWIALFHETHQAMHDEEHRLEAEGERLAEQGWLRAAENDPVALAEDERERELEAMDEGLAWMRAQREAK